MSTIAPQPPRSAAGSIRSAPRQPLRGNDRVDALLRDLRARGVGAVARGPSLDSTGVSLARCATGVPGLDRVLEGGLPRGRLSEIAGPISSGRTSLALALLARQTGAGEWTGWIETSDAFDPASAAAAGVILDRVLWVRAPGAREGLRAAEQLLEAQGFSLVCLDLSRRVDRVRSARERSSGDIPTSAWPRLRRRAASGHSALVTLCDERLAGTFADLSFELSRTRPRFEGRPALFTGLEGEVVLVRNRLGPSHARVSLETASRAATRAA